MTHAGRVALLFVHAALTQCWGFAAGRVRRCHVGAVAPAPRAAVGGVARPLRIELTGIARRGKRTHHGKRDACGRGDKHEKSDQATMPAELLSQLLRIVVEHAL